MSSFVHLHVHSAFSLLDAACRVEKLVDRAAELEMPAVALTDHGNMFGAIKFYKAAKDKGVKPILGCEVYLAPKEHTLKEPVSGFPNYYHLVLLAENMEGYRNLTKLVTSGYTGGFYYKPRIDKDLLRQHSGGLIALSACLQGEVNWMLKNERLDEARQAALEYAEIFGPEHFYLELNDHGIEAQRTIRSHIIQLSRDLALPLVATNDVHYLHQKDSAAHDVLICIGDGAKVSDEKRHRYEGDQFYFKSFEEMQERFFDVPEALENTVRIAERCDVQFTFGGFIMPAFQVPEGRTLDEEFERLSWEGLEQRLADWEIPAEKQLSYRDRLAMEIALIEKMEFSGYFLIVGDFIRYAKEHDIPVGPGRGSAAGSLVAFSLGITDIDPLQFRLFFERFLNPERVTMPDIDIDFCQERREEVIQYVREKYGDDRVCQIITFNSMKAKAVIKDVGRALDIPYSETDKISKLIGNELNITIADALEKEPEIRTVIGKDPQMEKLIEVAQVLEGLPRHVGIHAAGVVITRDPLTSYLPLYKTQDNQITTQFEMSDVEKLGLLKMDFLGLRTLTVLQNTLRQLDRRNVHLDLAKIDYNDKAPLAMMAKGKTIGVFQFESSGMRDLLRKCPIDRFEDLIALVSLFRPGPMQMLPDFIARKKDPSMIRYDDPRLEDILKETYGIMVYQEQVMQIANVLADYSLGQADQLRRVMGKKKAELLVSEGHQERFITNALAGGMVKERAQKVFDHMAQFAGYGFNKSHAAAYAWVSFQTAYLKCHYPREYMAALLNSWLDKTDMVVHYINECRAMGIQVLPPDINHGAADFTVHGDKIYFGLQAIKNIGHNSIEAILEERERKGPFSSVYDLARRVPSGSLNKRVLEGLVKSGALDATGTRRSQMLEAVGRALESGSRAQEEKAAGQASLLDVFGGSSMTGTFEEFFADVPEYSKGELLEMEKESIGFFVSGHPLKSYERVLQANARHTTSLLREASDGTQVVIGGLISSISRKTDKRNERYAILNFEDLYGVIPVWVGGELYQEEMSRLKTDMAVLIKGRLEVRDDRRSIRASTITPLDDLRKKFRRVTITVKTLGMGKEHLDDLYQVLRGHPGECDVYINLMVWNAERESWIQVSYGSEFRVSPEEGFVREAERLLGDASLDFAGAETGGYTGQYMAEPAWA